MCRTALIALSLSVALAACAASAPSRDSASPDREAGPATVIICTIPGAEPRRILVPDGRNPADFCPAGAIADRFNHIDPGAIYRLPAMTGIPPPCVSCDRAAGGGP